MSACSLAQASAVLAAAVSEQHKNGTGVVGPTIRSDETSPEPLVMHTPSFLPRQRSRTIPSWRRSLPLAASIPLHRIVPQTPGSYLSVLSSALRFYLTSPATRSSLPTTPHTLVNAASPSPTTRDLPAHPRNADIG